MSKLIYVVKEDILLGVKGFYFKNRMSTESLHICKIKEGKLDMMELLESAGVSDTKGKKITLTITTEIKDHGL